MRYSRISIDSGTMSKAVSDRFVKSFLDLFVLDLLDDGPKHGYEIMRELKNRTGARIGAGDEAQEARLQEHRTPRPALERGPSFPARLEPFQKLLVSKERTADTQGYCADLS